MACPLPGHHGRVEAVWHGHHLVEALACWVVLLCPHLYILYNFSDILSIKCVNCNCVVLFCICDIDSIATPSWERDPSSVAILEVFPVKRFFLSRNNSLRTEDVIHSPDCKAHWGNVVVIWGYIDKTDLIWLSLIYLVVWNKQCMWRDTGSSGWQTHNVIMIF